MVRLTRIDADEGHVVGDEHAAASQYRRVLVQLDVHDVLVQDELNPLLLSQLEQVGHLMELGQVGLVYEDEDLGRGRG